MLNEYFRPPMKDDVLREHNFFELYPLDGGGRFIFAEIFGTLEDKRISDGILNHGTLSDFGALPGLDFGKYEKWRTAEKSCWLSRFYFIPPMAKAYWLSGDEKIAGLVKDAILHFIRNHPPPRGKDEIGSHISHVYRIRAQYNRNTFRENQEDETDINYIWFDFQPASRLLHLIYAAHFLKNSDSISSVEREEISKSIHEHAEVIFLGEKYFNGLKKGNHQSLRGGALLYAGCYFEKCKMTEDFLRKGIEICNFHIKNDFMPDGALRENSPSYHIFESWHMRDAGLLSRMNGFELCPELAENLKKAAVFTRSICQPDFRSPVINDGYGVDVKPFLRTLPFREPAETKSTYFYNDAGIGICREGGNYLLFDSSPYTGKESHYHAGKNALTYWREGAPFFIDSGCCSYDDELFSRWYKQGEAHSTLLVNGSPESINEGTYSWSSSGFTEVSGWKRLAGGGFNIASSLTSSNPEWAGGVWKREITVCGNFDLRICDRVDFKTEKTLEFIFNLHPEVEPLLNDGALWLNNGKVGLSVEFTGSRGIRTSLAEGKCFLSFKHVKTKRIIVRAETAGDFTLTSEIRGPYSRGTR